MTEYKLNHFALRSDGRIVWVPEAPEEPDFTGVPSELYEDYCEKYDKALQAAIANGIEVSNQEQVKIAIVKFKGYNPNDLRCIDPDEDTIYSLPCRVKETTSLGAEMATRKVTVTFEQKMTEQTNPQAMTPEEILGSSCYMDFDYVRQEYLEQRLIVEKEVAISAMQEYADSQCAPLREEIERFKADKWISVKDQIPPDYQQVMFFDSRDNSIHVGYFVWGQTPVKHVTHWQPLPEKPKQ